MHNVNVKLKNLVIQMIAVESIQTSYNYCRRTIHQYIILTGIRFIAKSPNFQNGSKWIQTPVLTIKLDVLCTRPQRHTQQTIQTCKTVSYP